MDAHGKNFSLLHGSSFNLSLAPFYDIVCTRVYESLTVKMAMKIGSQYGSDNIFPRDWEKFCSIVQYAYPALKKLIKEQGEAILVAMNQEKEHLIQIEKNHPIIDKIMIIIQDRIARTLKQWSNN